MAEAFLHAATHAPQPMQAAASIAVSASVLAMGRALPSGAPPVLTETKPPAWMMRSNALRSVTKSLSTGKALGAPRLDDNGVAIVEMAQVQLADRRAALAPCGQPLMTMEHSAANAFPAIGIEGNRFLARGDQALR